jgi:prepilin-type N-terminal cleavage/methylation domain-containing protein
MAAPDCRLSQHPSLTPQHIHLESAMRKAHTDQRRGFTLVETVVTVGIVAALAAVVYPAVVKQFDSADPTRAAEDFNNLKTGIETFGVNVRPHQPHDIEDLANVLRTVAPDSTARGALYSAADSANWIGPYITLSVAANVADDATVITTGFGGTILNRLPLFDVDAANGGDTVNTSNVASAEFVSVLTKGLTGAAFNAINLLIDGPSESTAATRRQQGRFRCPGAAPLDTDACTSAFYLAVSVR